MPTGFRGRRTHYYEARLPERDLQRYHLSEQQIAGLFGTETRHPPLFRIPRHAHDLPSFYLVLEGSLTEFYSRTERELQTRSFVFTPPGEIHSNAFHRAGGRCFLVELPQHWTDRLTTFGVKVEQSFIAGNCELTWLATRLYKEFRNVDKLSPLSVEGLTLEILGAFSRESIDAAKDYLPVWLRDARDLLHDRFSETLTLDQIALSVGVHPVQLARAFRKRYRCSLAEYQRRLRVEEASRQLVATTRPLAEIASCAGFADQSHFSRVFRQRTGLSPAKFRAMFTLS